MDIVLSFYWRKIATHLAFTVFSDIEAVKKGKNAAGAQGIYIAAREWLMKVREKVFENVVGDL